MIDTPGAFIAGEVERQELNAKVGHCRLTPGWKQLTPRLLSGTFRDFQLLKL